MDVREYWNHSDENTFIDLVRQYPPLWNTADRNYSKKSVKKCLYTQVAEDFKRRCPDKVLTSGSARRKFNALRSYFQKELKKMKTIRKNSAHPLPPKWIHFEKMLFLAEEDERKKYEYSLNISIVNVKGGLNDDIETKHSVIVPETSCSESNEGMDSLVCLQPSAQSNEDSESPIQQKSRNTSSLVCESTKTETPVILKAWYTFESDKIADSLQPSLQSNGEDFEPPLKQKSQHVSSLVCDSTKTETPVILKAWSTSESNEGVDSLQTNKEDSEPPLKQKSPNTSSPVCDSSKTETPVILKASSTPVEGPPAFNVALGNLVVASLNQMPVEKANAATKEIFEILLKYGSESNHRR